MKKFFIYLLLTLSIITIVSCNKEEDPAPIDNSGSKEHYFPLSIGNSWTYNSSYYGEYTVSITKKEIINNKEYYAATNSVNPNNNGYFRYEGNKFYTLSNYKGIEFTLLMNDEDAKEGQEWLAGKIAMSIPGMYSYTVKYTCKYVKFHQTYIHNDKNYSNVMEVNMKTSIEDFILNSQFTAGLSPEDIESFTENYKKALEINSINQTTFLGKGIGYINQASEQMSLLNVDLISYIIK